MILLSIASKQIWPQVLAVAHLRPETLLLLHSDDVAESKGPAQRLQRFFEASGLLSPGQAKLERIPHDDFAGVEQCFDRIVAEHQINLGDCVINFTGGNKLMATAIFRSAARRGVRAFYLERGSQITWFEPRDGEMLTHTEPMPPDTTNDLDPAALLACQFGEDVVRFAGEKLRLNEKGQKATQSDLSAKLSAERLSAFDFSKWLTIEDQCRGPIKEGDNLEYATACALLRCGVPVVRRGIELATLPNSRNAEGELDLVFNWQGRLWVVDCKDRVANESKTQALQNALLRGGGLDRQSERLIQQISDDLRDREIKILREDLLQISEVGGLLGCALAVRSARPPMQAIEFAASRHPQVELVERMSLMSRLPAILKGRRAGRIPVVSI